MTAPTVESFRYGDDPAQTAALYRPVVRSRHATLVLFHGGFWRPAVGADHLAGVASDLAERGWVVWNVEYRRGAGRAPATLEDVAAAIDSLEDVPGAGADRVLAVGHSAGGHLATWAAGRAAPAVKVRGVVSLAGVLDLATAAHEGIGEGAVSEFMGGSPEELPALYALTDPLGCVPLSAPVRCVHARADARVPFAQSETYVSRARAAGADATLHEAAGDHFSIADASSPDWPLVVAVLDELDARVGETGRR